MCILWLGLFFNGVLCWFVVFVIVFCFGVGVLFDLWILVLWFFWELVGLIVLLLGMGVDIFVGFLVFGKELVFVVFWRYEGEVCVWDGIFVRGDEVGVVGFFGDDFWKKDMMFFCLVEVELLVLEVFFVFFVGVWVVVVVFFEVMVMFWSVFVDFSWRVVYGWCDVRGKMGFG